MAQATAGETTVTEGHGASIPASVRRRLDIRPGDRLLWKVEGSRIVVRVRKRRPGAFEDFKPFDFGVPTNAAEEHDEVF